MAKATGPGTSGIRLFRLFGIDVYLHWMWALVAIYEVNARNGKYSSPVWNAVEYLGLFVIVLMHEFGHALACKSVGGEANRIMLWPLGGVAFVSPPPRPGALLWSIAAGPLVNVVLAPVLFIAYALLRNGTIPSTPDLTTLVNTLLVIDIILFVFNMLPIYPLDGGQIVRALLWFMIGRAKSLMVASVIGMVGAVAVIIAAAWTQDTWLIVLALFGIWRSWSGFQQAQRLGKLMAMPTHAGVGCPSCGAAPPAAPLWKCACGATFDTFQTGATCPQCGVRFAETACLHCGKRAPIGNWLGMQPIPAPARMATPLPMPPLEF